MTKSAILALADGSVYEGYSFGAETGRPEKIVIDALQLRCDYAA